MSSAVGCGAGNRPTPSDDPSRTRVFEPEHPLVKRSLRPTEEETWIGNGVAYGPYRDGQHPGGAAPTKAEVRQDLQLMSRHWAFLRLYGAAGPSETVLDVIHEDGLDMKVMLGIWIDAEERWDESGRVVELLPESAAANRREIEAALRLAAAYPKIVRCLSVGNETQIYWSAHRVRQEQLIHYVREVRARTAVPVTVADDFKFWNTPESRAVAREIDFIVTHIHPLWNSIALEDAVAWTRRKYAEVQVVHPDHTIVLGETGWATQKHNEGEQARLIQGDTGEAQQKVFFDAVSAWLEEGRIVSFYFEAFDENWKGGEHPNEVEKHWGLFRADRTPKEAVADGT